MIGTQQQRTWQPLWQQHLNTVRQSGLNMLPRVSGAPWSVFQTATASQPSATRQSLPTTTQTSSNAGVPPNVIQNPWNMFGKLPQPPQPLQYSGPYKIPQPPTPVSSTTNIGSAPQLYSGVQPPISGNPNVSNSYVTPIGGGQVIQLDPPQPLWLRFLPRQEAGGTDRIGTDKSLWGAAAAAGVAGTLGNLAQIGIDKAIYGDQTDFKKNIETQASLQQQIMEQYLPYMTTNRLGQFGNQAAIEAQRRSAEASYSVPALANLARANQSAAALENVASVLGSQAIQSAGRQNRNIQEQIANMGGPMTPAALSAIARNAAQGSAQAYDQALQQALAAASQNLGQAAQLRTGATQAAEQAAQRVYETYKRPAETETDLKALTSFTQTPLQLGLQQAEQHRLVVSNPLQALGQTILDDYANLSYLKRMEEAQKVGVQNNLPMGPSDYSGVYEYFQDPRAVDVVKSLTYNANKSPNTFNYVPNLVTPEEQDIFRFDPNKTIYLGQFFHPGMLQPPPPPWP